MTTADLRASALLQFSAFDSAGHPLGHVADLMINPQSRQIEWIVLTLPTATPAPSMFVAIPWRNVRVQSQPERTLIVAREAALAATPFSKSDWPALPPASNGWTRRWSALRGAPLISADRRMSGAVDDLLVNPESGQVRQALLSLSGLPGTGNMDYQLPPELMTCVPDRSVVRVQMSALQMTLLPPEMKAAHP